MINEALGQIRVGMVAALGLFVIWALSVSSIVDELKDRANAQDLAAWLLLRQEFAEFDGNPISTDEFRERFVASAPADSDAIDNEMKEPPPERLDLRPGADNSLSPEPITLRQFWPHDKDSITFKLLRREPRDGPYYVYRVTSDSRLLPFDDYDVLVEAGTCRTECVRVVADEKWIRGALDVAFSFHVRYQPKTWNDVGPRLWTYAPSEPVARSLRLTTPGVVAFLKDTWRQQHALWGISVDSGLFFTVPGILLGAQALFLLGPLLVLARRTSGAGEQLWIMAAPTAGTYGSLLEVMLLIVSIGWVIMPVAILTAQMAQGVHLQPLEEASYVVGAAGLVLATAVNAASAYQLRRLRRGQVVTSEKPVV